MNLIHSIYKHLISSRFHLLGAFCILLFAGTMMSCSDREEVAPEPDEELISDLEYYFTVTLTVPENTRSITEEDGSSNDGTQAGFENENKVSRAHLYFFDAERGDYLISFTASQTLATEWLDSKYAIYAKISVAQMRELFSHNSSHLYVIANADPDQTTFTNETEFKSATFSISNLNNATDYARPFNMNSTYGFACPMANSDYYTIDLSSVNVNASSSDAEVANAALSLFNSTYVDSDDNKANLWKISDRHGFLRLERSIARIDYKNYDEPQVFRPKDKNQNYYAFGPNGEQVYLEMAGMQVFNISKKSYSFRHTSDGNQTSGTRTGGNIAIFDTENDNTTPAGEGNPDYRWIYDCDWGLKTQGNIGNAGSLFLNSASTINGWKFQSSAYTRYQALHDNNSADETTNGYLPWHYVMENTLPNTDMMDLNYSTGVAFYLKVILKDANGVDKTPTDGNPFRVYMPDLSYQIPEWNEDEEYYYFTYKYLIEHNNVKEGNVNGTTGEKTNKAPMQIGIVRNNIYQLSVNSINNLPDPNEPDNVYMTVSVNVLDWNRRIIDYDF